MKTITLFLLVLSLILGLFGIAFAQFAKTESKSSDAKSTVMYGHDTSTTITIVKVASDGTLEVS